MHQASDLQLIIRALDTSPLATAVYHTADLHIAFANQEMLKMWCSNESIVGKTFADAFPSFEKEGFATILSNVWKTGTTYIANDTPADIKDGELFYKRYFDFEYKPLLNKKKETIAIIHTSIDVTFRNDAQRIIREHEQQVHFHKELDVITYTLAHDAKNPLNIAKLGVESLKSSQENRDNWLQVIEDALMSLNQIIDKTVQLSEARNYKVQKQQINIHDRINGWFAEGRILNGVTNIRIEYGELLPVNGDFAGIYQVFSNVIGNAIKYSSTREKPVIKISSECTSKGVVYYIQDNGIGIPQIEITKIFQQQHRGSNSNRYEGRGIGLFIVKKIMDRLEGQINISSTLNKGTEVRLFFPDA